jgi:hypothetical protein
MVVFGGSARSRELVVKDNNKVFSIEFRGMHVGDGAVCVAEMQRKRGKVFRAVAFPVASYSLLIVHSFRNTIVIMIVVHLASPL